MPNDPAVSHRIVTYFNRPAGEPGPTQLGSVRLDTLQALDWITQHAPPDTVLVEVHELRATITVDLRRLLGGGQ